MIHAYVRNVMQTPGWPNMTGAPWQIAYGRPIFVRFPGAGRLRRSATGGLDPGFSLEPLADRVQPAGPGAGALQPPGGPRITVAGQAGGYPPGGVEFTPDGDVEIGGGSPQVRDLVANGRDLGDGGPLSPAPGVDGNEPVPAGGPGHGPAGRMHPGHPAGGPGHAAACPNDSADPDGYPGPLHRAGREADRADREVLALMPEGLSGQQPRQDVQPLVEDFRPGAAIGRLAEQPELSAGGSAEAHAED